MKKEDFEIELMLLCTYWEDALNATACGNRGFSDTFRCKWFYDTSRQVHYINITQITPHFHPNRYSYRFTNNTDLHGYVRKESKLNLFQLPLYKGIFQNFKEKLIELLDKYYQSQC